MISVSKTLRTPSVTSPYFSACNTPAFCYVPNMDFPSLVTMLGISQVASDSIHPVCRCALRVAVSSGARIGEILRLVVGDILAVDKVWCGAEKGGVSFMIHLPGLSAQVSQWNGAGQGTRLFPCTYHACWAACVRSNIAYRLPERQNVGRTHIGRYLLAEKLLSKHGLNAVTDGLKHRSSSTASYYIKRKGGSCE
jgi:integrase